MYASLPAFSTWLAVCKNCDTSVSHTLTCYWLILFVVFSTIKISRTTLEEDVPIPAITCKEIIDHPSLGDLAKPWLRQSLPSQQPRLAVSGAWSGSWGWQFIMSYPLFACFTIQPALSATTAIFLALMPFLAASWDELGVNWHELGYSDAELEGRNALVFFFAGEGVDTSSVNTSLPLNPDRLQKFRIFSR